MKPKFLLLVGFLITNLISQGQPYLFGTNQSGNGNIIRYNVQGNKLEVASSFENDGLHPKQFSEPVRVAPGIFYGITSRGGQFGNGVIFKLDSASGKYTVVHDFGSEPAMFPAEQPVLANDGKLYGIANLRDTGYYSLLYSFDPSNGVFNIEFNLHSADFFSEDRLVNFADGKLYGTGSILQNISFNNRIFSFDPLNKTFSLIENPDDSRGNYDMSKLVNGLDGMLYGLSGPSDAYVVGAILSFNPVTGKSELLKRFAETGEDGIVATSLIEYHGALYGSTDQGGANGNGVVFSYNLASKKYDTLVSIPPDIDYPYHNFATAVLVDYDGVIHGMDMYGVFSFDPATRVYNHLTESAEPAQTHASFVVNDTGVIAINPGSAHYLLVKRLNAPNGMKPAFDLSKGVSGLLYGATTTGGLHNWGGLFSFDPKTSALTMLHDFNYVFEATGPIAGATGPFIEMDDGNVYFLVEYSEELYQLDGSLIRYNKSNKSLERVHDFKSVGLFVNGKSLVKGEDGYLYGLASFDRYTGNNVLYRYSTIDDSFEQLSVFQSTTDGLVQGRDNILYALNASGLVSYNIPLHQLAFYPYKVSGGLSIDSTGNLLFKSENNIVRFNVSTHEFSVASIIQSFPPFNSPMLVSKDSTLYFSYVWDLEYHHIVSEYNINDKIFSIKESDGIPHVLTDMPGLLYCRTSVLYSQPIRNVYSSITITDTSVYESDGKAVIRVHLSKPLPYTLKLNYRTTDGTARSSNPGRDYIGANGHLYIRKGAVDKTIRVIVLKDKLKEPAEQFMMKITKAGSVSDTIVTTDDEATITILDGTRPNSIIPVSIETVSKSLVAIQPKSSTLEFNVVVTPNPSNTVFNIRVDGNAEPIKIQIVDALGRIRYNQTSVKSNSNWLVGSDWHPGIYFAIIQQGKETRVIKMVKKAR